MAKDVIQFQDEVNNRIRYFQNQYVILDSDLAHFFNVETRVLNQAAQRNSKRFPNEFRFQISESDFNSLISQFVISKGGNRKLPWAYVFSSELITKAKKSIILIDNYIDETTLVQLSKRNKKVHCIIYTEKITEQSKLDLEKHNAQYDSIEIRILKNAHDRFLILDEKELYHLGASLKDLGKRWFAFSKLDGLVLEVLNHLR